MRFYITNINGEILRTGICSDSVFDLQAKEGEFTHSGHANDATQYFDITANILCDYTETELQQKDNPPYGYRWKMPEKQLIQVVSDEEIYAYKANKIRTERNILLSTTVDTMNSIRWETLTDIQKQQWIEYRQALLDVPQQEGFPNNVTWPIKPE